MGTPLSWVQHSSSLVYTSRCNSQCPDSAGNGSRVDNFLFAQNSIPLPCPLPLLQGPAHVPPPTHSTPPSSLVHSSHPHSLAHFYQADSGGWGAGEGDAELKLSQSGPSYWHEPVHRAGLDHLLRRQFKGPGAPAAVGSPRPFKSLPEPFPPGVVAAGFPQ